MTPPPDTARIPKLPRIGFGMACLGIAVLALSPVGYRLGWFNVLVALLYVIPGGVLLAALAFLACTIAIFLGRRSADPRPLWLAVAGLVLSAVAIGYPVSGAVKSRTVPPIHDITTDTGNPPQFVALAAARKAAPNGVAYEGERAAAEQRKAYADIAPLRFALAPEALFAQVERAARDAGWEIAAAVPAEGRLEATATTPLYGFKDDVVVRIAAAPGGSRLDIRSASRVGVSDLGTNAARIRAFSSDLKRRAPAN